MIEITKKPAYPKLEGVIASHGLTYKIIGDTHGMGAQAFGRRMNKETDFTLDEIVWLTSYFKCDFTDLF